MAERTRKKLNKSTVDRLEPAQRDYYVWDTDLTGFAVRVWPSGSKTYVYQYRTPEGRQRLYKIARHGDLTPEQARDTAKDIAAGIRTRQDTDPQEQRQQRRQALTVSELIDAYMASAKYAEHAPSTKITTKSHIEGHLRPLIGGMTADKLTKEDVRRLFSDIRAGKTAKDKKTNKSRGRSITRGGEGSARKVIRIFKAILNWGIEEDYLKDNPAQGLKFGVDGQRRAILHTQEQYSQVFRTLEKMEVERRLPAHIADALRVIVFTGARRGEIANLKWSHVDLQKGLLVLPAGSHKTGRKTGEAREIGLPSVVQAIIARQPQKGPDDLVFPSTKNGGPIDLSHYWTKARIEADLPADIVLHSLRHSLASSLAFQGAQAAEIMAAMGHKHISTSQKYIHWTQDAKAALAERYTAGIAAAMNGKTDTAEVVDINKKLENE